MFSASTRAPSAAAPPKPRAPSGAVEIPSDPGSVPLHDPNYHVCSLSPWEGSLSIKELKELLTALGIDHDGCLEKACKDKALFSCLSPALAPFARQTC